VTVQLVLKSKMSMPGFGGRSNESKQDATGTMIDPSGLTVLALRPRIRPASSPA